MKRRLSIHEAVVISGYNLGFGGPILVPFMYVHKDVESRSGGVSIDVNEYNDPDFQKTLREMYYDDMMKIIPKISQKELDKAKEEISDEQIKVEVK